MSSPLQRCWDNAHEDPIHVKYHDEEWGVPLHDDPKLLEFLILGGFQAGLTWWLILQRREAFRCAFDNFKPSAIAAYDDEDVKRLMQTPLIIHNKMKISAAINNAKRFIEVQEEFGSFDKFIWGFVGGQTVHNTFSSLESLPPETETSRQMSKALRERGFLFVGPTICYAFMQATGMVNDHLVSCFRYNQLRPIKRAFKA